MNRLMGYFAKWWPRSSTSTNGDCEKSVENKLFVSDPESEIVNHTVKRIFYAIEHEYRRKLEGNRLKTCRPGCISRCDALNAVERILGCESPDEEAMTKLCPETWKSNELNLEQFKELVYTAGAWSALRYVTPHLHTIVMELSLI